MEILIYKDSGCCEKNYVSFEIHRNGWCDRCTSKETNNRFKSTIQREGYVRKIIPLTCSIHRQSEHKFLQNLKTTKEQLFSMFSIPKDIKNDYLIKDIDPWICFSEGFDIVLYFGTDKPVLKEKTVKSNTKHRLTWAHYSKHQFDGTPATYKYWDVKDKSKLIICSIWLKHLNYTFPELEYKFDHNWMCYNSKVSELILNEPFKATREYDYSDEEKKVIIEEEKRKREEKERKRKELEERKNTPGYCHLCGAKHAEYIPFEGMYMCENCYRNSKY